MSLSDPERQTVTPPGLAVADDLRIETLDDEVVVLDAGSGVVFHLQGAAARLVATLYAGGVPDAADLAETDVITALREMHILL
jgi:hypothetical protein